MSTAIREDSKEFNNGDFSLRVGRSPWYGGFGEFSRLRAARVMRDTHDMPPSRVSSTRAPRRHGRTLQHWLTFGDLAHELDLPPFKRRWLQRRILHTHMHERLGIQPADTLQSAKPMPVPPKSGRPAWLLRRDLLIARRDELLSFLFPPDIGMLG